MNKKVLKIVILCCLVAALSFALASCKLFGSNDDSGTGNGNHSNVSVEQMPVKGAVDELWFDSNDGRIKWTGVENSLYYKVTINGSDERIVYVNQLDSYYAQDFTLSVFAVRGNNTKTAIKTASFSYVPLSGLRVDASSDRAVWTAVEGATGYEVMIRRSNSKEDPVIKTVTTTSCSLSDVTEYGSYSVSVRALIPDGLTISSVETITEITRISQRYFVYNGANARFEAESAYTYHVTIGDEEEFTFSDGAYDYVPTEDVEVSYYATGSNPNVLRSETTKFTIFVIDPISDLTFDGTTFSWSPVNNEYIAYYELVVDHNGTEHGYQVGTSNDVTTYTLNGTREIAAGQFVTVTVRPKITFNAIVQKSNPIKIFKTGCEVKLDFATTEYRRYGAVEAGDNVFTMTGKSMDEGLTAENGGFVLTLTGAEETRVEIQTEENVYTATYGGFLFETPGTYTVTATPLYPFGEDVIKIGDDSFSTYTITRAAPLTDAELVSYELKPMLKCKGARGFIDRIVTKGENTADPAKVDLKNARVEDGYTYIALPYDNDSQGKVDYSVTVYPRDEKISLYEYYSWQQSGVRSMTLRSLTGTTVSYKVSGTVPMDTLILNGKTQRLSWEYGEEATTHISLTYKDSSGVTHTLPSVTTTERELSFVDYTLDGTFAYGGTLQIYILGDPDNPDPEERYFSCGQARTKSITQLTAPVLTMYAATTDYLMASLDKPNSLDTENYKVNDAADTNEYDVLGGEKLQFNATHVDKTIRMRYRSLSNFVLPSLWTSYAVTEPSDSSMTLYQSVSQGEYDKYIRWTAAENYSEYRYSITGDVGKEETVTEASTSNLYNLLASCARATCHFEVEAVGHIDGDDKVVYLQKKIVDDDFYTVYLTAHRVDDTHRLSYDIYAAPEGFGPYPLSVSISIRTANNSATRNTAAVEGEDVDITDTIVSLLEGKTGTQSTVVSMRLTDSVASNYNRNKAFLMNNSFVVNVTRYAPSGGTITYGMNG